MDREIPDHDLALLRKICGLPGTEPLPEKLVGKYWAAKIVSDRAGAGVLPVRNEFLRIATECGFGKLTEREANPDIVTLFRRKQVKAGQPIIVNWREKKVEATLIGVNGMNEVTVMIDGQERKVTRESVTLAA